ncbi:MAG: hypothetical protein IKD46_07190 [Lentisphaeria bacterium]|nr:hypothetical protein [Lentisphaeria bacterium]
MKIKYILLGCCCFLAWGLAGTEISLGTPVRESEMRTLFPVVDGKERYIIADVQDYAERGYLLKTDLLTGRTRKLLNPPEVVQDDSFGAMVTGDRHFFYSQGNVVLSCDLRKESWRVWGKIDPETSYYFAFTEGADGTVWCGGYPKTKLLSLDRKTGIVTDHGRMDPKEAYLTSLAQDDRGFLYGAIAQTRRGLVAYHPATGEKRQLLPNALRKNGRLYVYRGRDGAVYTTVDGRIARLYNGSLEWVNKGAARAKDFHGATYLAPYNKTFPDGTSVFLYDTGNRRVTLQLADDSLRHLDLGEHSGGTKLSGKVLMPDGKLFLSSGHPMHFASADLNTGKLHDFGPIPYVAGGTFTVMQRAPDGKIYAGQYAGGGLWVYDPSLPWMHPGISKPLFGKSDPVELARSFQSPPGTRCVRLNAPDVIFFRGADWQTKTFTVRTGGRYFVNIMFLTCPAYGDVFLKMDGEALGKVQTKSAVVSFTPVLSYPVELSAGEHVFSIRCADKKAMTGMVAFEIGKVDRSAEWGDGIRENPRSLGFWINETGQPRGLAVSPDNKKVYLGGLAGYGLSGGKLIEYDTASGKSLIHDILAPGESVEDLQWLENGLLAIGTTIRAQGGGRVLAKHAAVKLFDPRTGKMVAEKMLEGERLIDSVIPWQGVLAAVGNMGKLYLLDPQTLEVKRTVRTRLAGSICVTQTPVLVSPEGVLYLFSSRGIGQLRHPSGAVERIFASEERKITSGAAYYKGRLYFIRSHEIFSVPVQPQ